MVDWYDPKNCMCPSCRPSDPRPMQCLVTKLAMARVSKLGDISRSMPQHCGGIVCASEALCSCGCEGCKNTTTRKADYRPDLSVGRPWVCQCGNGYTSEADLRKHQSATRHLPAAQKGD